MCVHMCIVCALCVHVHVPPLPTHFMLHVVCVFLFVCGVYTVCVHVCAHMPPLPPHMMPAHTTHPSTLPSTVQAANTVEEKGAHAMSHTTLLRSKVNMGFLEQETQTRTHTELKSKEGGSQLCHNICSDCT